MKPNLDHLDRKLISLLRQNGRASFAELSKHLQVSRVTVQNRIERLTKQGVIVGYTAIIGNQADEQLAVVRAFMSLELSGNTSNKVKAALLQEPSITAIHSTNGRWDLLVEIETGSLAEFDKVLGRIRNFTGISSSETSILLSTMRLHVKH